MKRYFNIQLQWIDDQRIINALVTDYDDFDPEKDEEVFWFGISEEEIQYHIQTGEPVCNQFVIISYEETE